MPCPMCAQGRWVYGWDDQLEHYGRKWAQPVQERLPRMVWRGRTEHAYRDEWR